MESLLKQPEKHNTVFGRSSRQLPVCLTPPRLSLQEEDRAMRERLKAENRRLREMRSSLRR